MIIATHESCPLGKLNELLLLITIEETMKSKAPCRSSTIASNICPMSGELTKGEPIIAQTKRTRLLHLSVRIKIKSTMILILQSSEVLSAFINTRFQAAGYLYFGSSCYDKPLLDLTGSRSEIELPAQGNFVYS